jgi:paraquat-inducible protein B
MSKPANKTVIGIFVVVALVLVIGAVLLLGSGKFFKNNVKAVMYFQGSVKGLSVGSPVTFRGVKVGSVTDIKMILNPKDLSITIPVYVEFEQGSMEAVGGGSAREAYARFYESRSDRTGMMQNLIKAGLKGQLEMQSIVTGQLLVALDFNPDKPMTLVGVDRKTLEIPTIPTPLQELTKRFEKIPIEDIVGKISASLTGIEKIVNSPEVSGSIAKLNATMGGIEKIVNSPETTEMLRSVKQSVDDARVLIKNIDGQVGPLADEVKVQLKTLVASIEKLTERLEAQIQPLIASLTQASEQTRLSMKKVDEATDESPIIADRLGKTLDELTVTARSLRLLTDTLQSQPESLIFGKKNTRGK